jgi:MFS family permease
MAIPESAHFGPVPREAAASAGAQPQALNFPLLLLTAALGSIIAPLNSTMIAVALPDIRSDFGVSHSAVTWLVSAYLISMAVAQPLGGRLGDQLGRSRVFKAGLLAFLGFSFACAAAPSFWALIAMRSAQALVGAAVIPNGVAMVRETVEPRKLGQANGLTGSAIGLSAAAGPVLGAALLGFGSWRLLFVVNIPLVAAALLCLYLLHYHDRPSASRSVIDWLGAGLLAGFLVALTRLLGAVRGELTQAELGLTLVALFAFAGLFLRRQSSSPIPLAEWRLFRNRSYFGSTTYILLGNLVMYTTLLAVPFFIKEVQHKPVGTAGFLIGTLSILMSLLAPVSGLLSDARGRRWPAMAGAACQAVAVIMLLIGIGTHVSSLYLAACLAILGTGSGLGTGAANTASVEAAPRHLAGSAAGTMSMMRYFGSIVGAAALGGILSTGAAAPSIAVFHLLFGLLLAMAVGAFLCSTQIHVFAEEHTAVTPVGEA